jgi:hypothetical protein
MMNASLVRKRACGRATNAQKARLETLLSRGVQPFYQWLREQAETQPQARFQPETSLENPISRYLSAQLHGKRVALFGWKVKHRNARVPVPPPFLRVLQAIHRGHFSSRHPKACEIRDWMDRIKIELEPGTPGS